MGNESCRCGSDVEVDKKNLQQSTKTESPLDIDFANIEADLLSRQAAARYSRMTQVEEDWATRQGTQFVLRHAFKTTYRHIKKLGQGGQGEVHQIERVEDGFNFAAKFTKVTAENREDLVELAVMSTCDCPYLIKLHDAFECKASDCKFLTKAKLQTNGGNTRINVVVMELVQTGNPQGTEPDLMSWVMQNLNFQPMSEAELATMVRNVSLALQCLNETENIHALHRDLKPENILVPPEGVSHLKVTDYGLSRIGVDTGEDCFIGTYNAGTPGYVAPEVRRRLKDNGSGKQTAVYGPKADIWSLGVIMYICVEGCAPYGLGTKFEPRTRLSFSVRWNRMSTAARRLCTFMLESNPEVRISVGAVLADRWVNENALPVLPSAGAPAE